MASTESSWIVLVFAFITTIPDETMANANLSQVSPLREKCQNVYNSNNFYAGPNKKVETLLHEVKKELKEIQKDISHLKGNRTSVEVFRNCAELYKAGKRVSGVYTIDPDNSGAFEVFCDQKTAGGGWTVFQKRLDGSVDFYRAWNDYKRGFGNLNGTAGDSFSYHRGSAFSTKERDNDQSGSSNCATRCQGAWWYNSCLFSNLNGLYLHGPHSTSWEGVNWYDWKGNSYSAKRAEMKIKPVN